MNRLASWYRSGLWTARALGCLVNGAFIVAVLGIGSALAKFVFMLFWNAFGPFSFLEMLVGFVVAIVTWVYVIRRWKYYKETANERAFRANRVKKMYKDQL